MRNSKFFSLLLAFTLLGVTTSCGQSAEVKAKAQSDSYEAERVERFTKNYCEFVNDLTVSSGFFYTVMHSGMPFRKGDLYAGSWVYRIGEMLKINQLEDTPEGKWIAAYAAYFENLNTKFKETDERPTKVELAKLGALVGTLQSQSTGFKKWDACSSDFEPTTAENKALLESMNNYKDFIENPSK